MLLLCALCFNDSAVILIVTVTHNKIIKLLIEHAKKKTCDKLRSFINVTVILIMRQALQLMYVKFYLLIKKFLSIIKINIYLNTACSFVLHIKNVTNLPYTR